MERIYRKGEYLAQTLAISEQQQDSNLSNPRGGAVPTVYGTVNFAPPIIYNKLTTVKNSPSAFHTLPLNPARVIVYGLSQNNRLTTASASEHTQSRLDKIFFDGVNVNKKNIDIVNGKEDTSSRYLGSNTGAFAGKYVAWFQQALTPGEFVPQLLYNYGINFLPYYMDFLVVVFQMENENEPDAFNRVPDVSVTYRRKVYDRTGTQATEDTHASICIGDYLSQNYGLRIPINKINHSSFFNNKNRKLGVVLDNESNTLIDNLEILVNADNGLLYQDGDEFYYANESDAGSADFTINEDSIIGSIEILSPEADDKIDVLYGKYNSHEGGERLLAIGETDYTQGDRTKSLDLTAFSVRGQSEVYLKQMFNKITNQRTFEFKLDRSGQQIAIGDVLSVSTTYPSLTNQLMRVVRITLDTENYTFDLECIEHDNDYYAPFDGNDTRLVGALPLIPTNGGSYQPPEYEFDFPDGGITFPDPTPPIPPDAPPPPDQGETRPTIPTQVTVVNTTKRHPYNERTGNFNTNWYLGSMYIEEDGDKKLNQDTFDFNGIDVTLTDGIDQSGIYWRVRWALTWRYEDHNKPDAVVCLMDLPTFNNRSTSVNVGYYDGYRLSGRYQLVDKAKSNENGFVKSKYVSTTSETEFQESATQTWPNKFTASNRGWLKRSSIAKTYPYYEDTGSPNSTVGVFECREGESPVNFYRADPNNGNPLPFPTSNPFSRIQDDFPTQGTDNKYRFNFFEIRGDIMRYIGYTTAYVDGRSLHTSSKQRDAEKVWSANMRNTAYPYTYTATGVQ